MIVNVYILMVPGGDRPYVSTTLPSEALQRTPGTKLFLAPVELPGFDRGVDGVVQVKAAELPLSIEEKHV